MTLSSSLTDTTKRCLSIGIGSEQAANELIADIESEISAVETQLVEYQYIEQDAPAEIADGDTALTAANLAVRLMTMESSTAGRAPTVPTGTAMNGIVSVGYCIDWTFINTGNQIVTITQATGHTLVGDMTLAAGESGTFRTRVSAANTAITYRL